MTMVAAPTPALHGFVSGRWKKKCCQVSGNDNPRATASPKNGPSWAVMIRQAAPAVKLTTTVWEMRFTSAPRRASPRPSCIRPTSSVSVSASRMYCSLPGSASGARLAKTKMEMTLVGPR